MQKIADYVCLILENKVGEEIDMMPTSIKIFILRPDTLSYDTMKRLASHKEIGDLVVSSENGKLALTVSLTVDEEVRDTNIDLRRDRAAMRSMNRGEWDPEFPEAKRKVLEDVIRVLQRSLPTCLAYDDGVPVSEKHDERRCVVTATMREGSKLSYADVRLVANGVTEGSFVDLSVENGRIVCRVNSAWPSKKRKAAI